MLHAIEKAAFLNAKLLGLRNEKGNPTPIGLPITKSHTGLTDRRPIRSSFQYSVVVDHIVRLI